MDISQNSLAATIFAKKWEPNMDSFAQKPTNRAGAEPDALSSTTFFIGVTRAHKCKSSQWRLQKGVCIAMDISQISIAASTFAKNWEPKTGFTGFTNL